jgi:1-acyl-sn-glycerol-3-phosphate acyltransferase
MNIFRPQQPYVFRPPRYSPILGPVIRQLSLTFFLRRKFRVRSITAEGVDRVAALARDGHSILVGPNHADHADPHVLLRLGNQAAIRFHFMAAREGFEGKRLHRFLLQRCGAFSVDREGADIAAFKTAVRILREARFPLVVFPEGEIYHHHEQLDPLNEGVATMLLRAAAKSEEDRRAYLVPTAMRYAYDETATATFSSRLDALEERITWKPRGDMDVVDRIYRLGGGLLAIKEVEFLDHPQTGDLVDRISNLRNRLVEMVEAKHDQTGGAGSIPERVKALRGRIRSELTDPEAEISPERSRSLYDDLDTLFVVVQLYSYPGLYLREEPSVHRIAETILKLEEDVLGAAVYDAPRDVLVRFGEPIDVRRFLEDRSLTARTGVGPLTADLREEIESMLGELR